MRLVHRLATIAASASRSGPLVPAAKQRALFGLCALAALVGLSALLPQAGSGQGVPPPDQVGEWGSTLSWPTQGKHLALMPTGKVLVWPTGQTAHVWNPGSGSFKSVPATFGDLHCAGHVTLVDGSPFVVGGVDVSPFVGIKVAASFDPETETWTNRTPMKYARWYPTVTSLGDGRVLAVSGTDENKAKATIPEIYDPKTDSWSQLTGASRTQPLYPFMYQLPNGKVYDAAPKSATSYLDVSGAGAWSSGPPSGWDNQAGGCCNEAGAMYDKGKIIRSGGGDPAHARTGIIDMTAASPQWKEVEPMAFPRRRHNMVILADGSMLAVGGTRVGDDQTQAVLEAERWDPATEQWDTMSRMSVPRMYHSAAMLLPDGRVVASGGDSPASQAKLTAQIYSPPYLFKGARPAITSAPSGAAYGSTFSVGTDTPGIESVALIRPGSVTHAIDFNQRFIPLTFTQSGQDLTVTAPANGNVAPPGTYMMVVKNGDGVPSVARWVRINESGTLPPPPDPTPPTAGFVGTPTSGTAPLTVAFANTATGSTPMTFEWDFENNGTVDSTDPNPRFTYPAAGKYTVKLRATNAAGADEEIKADYVTVNEPSAPSPPTADFTASPTIGTAPLQVAFQNRSGGSTPQSFKWDFQNDGTVDSTAENPTFIYSAPGTYSVKLVTTNDHGSDEEVKADYVSVAAPPTGGTLSFSAQADARVQESTPTTNYGTSSLRVDGGTDPDVDSYLRFNVTGTGNVTSAKLRLYATSDSANGPAVFSSLDTSWSEAGITWGSKPLRDALPLDDKGAVPTASWAEFDVTPHVSGDGSYTFVVATDSTDGQNFNSREATNATLRPQLVVTSSAPAETPPTADFAATPTSGAAPLQVAFTDKSQGAANWAWDFQNDDSFESTDRNPTYTYTQPGTYTVRLQVENAVGGDEEIKTSYITVTAPSPGGTVTLAPVADAHVKSDAPTSNVGKLTQVRVDSSPVVNTYLKFDVRDLVGAPKSAKVRLYVQDPNPAGGSIYSVSNSWVESGTGGINFNNAPPISGNPLSSVGAAALNTWKEFDVTSAITGNGTYSFAIKGSSSDTVYYSSREGSAKPELVVTY